MLKNILSITIIPLYNSYNEKVRKRHCRKKRVHIVLQIKENKIWKRVISRHAYKQLKMLQSWKHARSQYWYKYWSGYQDNMKWDVKVTAKFMYSTWRDIGAGRQVQFLHNLDMTRKQGIHSHYTPTDFTIGKEPRQNCIHLYNRHCIFLNVWNKKLECVHNICI